MNIARQVVYMKMSDRPGFFSSCSVFSVAKNEFPVGDQLSPLRLKFRWGDDQFPTDIAANLGVFIVSSDRNKVWRIYGSFVNFDLPDYVDDLPIL